MIHRQFYYLMVYKIQIGSLYEDVQRVDIGNSLLGIGTAALGNPNLILSSHVS